MADYQPLYACGAQPFTGVTSAAVIGGRVAAISGSGTVAHAGADSADAIGVFAQDAGSGVEVAIWPLDGVIHEMEASGAITAGAGIGCDANGQVKVVAAGAAATVGSELTTIGRAMTTAAGSPLKLAVSGGRG